MPRRKNPEAIAKALLAKQQNEDVQKELMKVIVAPTPEPTTLEIVKAPGKFVRVKMNEELKPGDIDYLSYVVSSIVWGVSTSSDAFLGLLSKILYGTDYMVETYTGAIIPVWVNGYAISKASVIAIFDITSTYFEFWLSGALMYSLLLAFPTILVQFGVTDTLFDASGEAFGGFFFGTGGLLIKLTKFIARSAVSGTESLFKSAIEPENIWLSFLGIQTLTLFSWYTGLGAGAPSMVTALLYRTIGLPIMQFEKYTSKSLSDKYRKFGYKGILTHLSFLLAGGLSLWLVTPTMLDVVLRSTVPQMIINIHTLIVDSLSKTITGQNVIACIQAISTILVAIIVFTFTSFDITSKFPQLQYVQDTVSEFMKMLVMTDEERKIPKNNTTLVRTLVSFSSALGSTKMIDVLQGISGNIVEKVRIVGNEFVIGAERIPYANFADSVVMSTSIPAMLFEELGKGTVEEYNKIIKLMIGRFKDKVPGNFVDIDLKQLSRENHEEMIKLFDLTRPTIWWHEVSKLPFIKRVSILLKVFSAACMDIFSHLIEPLKILLAILLSILFIGFAWWLVAPRGDINKGEFSLLCARFAQQTIVFNEIIKDKPNYEEVAKHVSPIQTALKLGDPFTIAHEFIIAAKDLRKDILDFSRFEPLDPAELVSFKQLVPVMVQDSSQQVLRIEMMIKGIQPTSKTIDASYKARLARATEAVSIPTFPFVEYRVQGNTKKDKELAAKKAIVAKATKPKADSVKKQVILPEKTVDEESKATKITRAAIDIPLNLVGKGASYAYGRLKNSGDSSVRSDGSILKRAAGSAASYVYGKGKGGISSAVKKVFGSKETPVVDNNNTATAIGRITALHSSIAQDDNTDNTQEETFYDAEEGDGAVHPIADDYVNDNLISEDEEFLMTDDED
jgi:hypothetical protein